MGRSHHCLRRWNSSVNRCALINRRFRVKCKCRHSIYRRWKRRAILIAALRKSHEDLQGESYVNLCLALCVRTITASIIWLEKRLIVRRIQAKRETGMSTKGRIVWMRCREEARILHRRINVSPLISVRHRKSRRYDRREYFFTIVFASLELPLRDVICNLRGIRI